MRLVTYTIVNGEHRGGLVVGDSLDSTYVVDLASVEALLERLTSPTRGRRQGSGASGSLLELLRWRPDAIEWARSLAEAVADFPVDELIGQGVAHRLSAVRLRPPIPVPPAVRDFYAFEEHVRRARSRRGLAIPPEWYKFPAFYFSNPSSLVGPDEPVPAPRGSAALDYELEVAAIVGRACRDVSVYRAEEVIAGYTILNDWSARDVQRAEMQVGLGPAKGKDFATSLGPYLVTCDELADRRLAPGRYDLEMVARVNGIERSRGNWSQIYWTFAHMVARASENTWLLPGDVIGSGTVGSGCLLELGGDELGWLQVGDVVELVVERLGVLRNRVVEPADVSNTWSESKAPEGQG